MSPMQFNVPSTFLTFLGLVNRSVVIPNCSTIVGYIKHSVAPVSSNATRLAHFRLVCMETCFFIDLCLHLYTLSPATAWVRAAALRHLENLSHPPLHSLL